MSEKCYIYEKGNLSVKEVNYDLYGIFLGKFPAEVCDRCEETFFDEEISKKITKSAKKKELWELQAKTKNRIFFKPCR